MSAEQAIPYPKHIPLPDIPAICVNARECAILTEDGEMQTLSHHEAAEHIKHKPALLCHAPYTKHRLGFDAFHAFDILELFAFTHPAKFCVPTPFGLARSLGLSVPESFEDSPVVLIEIARALLTDLQKDTLVKKADPLKIAAVMGQKGKGWPWTPFVFAALGEEYNPQEDIISKTALNVWKHLPEWAEEAPEPPPSHHGVSESEAHEKLEELLNVGDTQAEARPQQKSYASAITKMFEPVSESENPHIVLAEAGTGVGKTLGYLAPASVWADKNEGAVWISTYTKNLQRQIDSELDRLYPHPEVKNAYVSMRKGRENYLCLLNLEDHAAAAALTHTPRSAIAAGIMARWVAATKTGDLSGSEFPGWLGGILGFSNTYALADRRGECIYSACDHYQRCFIERAVRKSKHARLVIANHALVMIQSAMSSPAENLPSRYIFDEGHHLFDAADSAFSAHLTARETADLRRWILGADSTRQAGYKGGRARGLKRRIEDLIEQDDAAKTALSDLLHHAASLCAQGWSRRFKDSLPSGPTEEFLMQIYRLVYARAEGKNTPYSIETELHPVDEETLKSCATLKTALKKILKPMETLRTILHKRLVDDQGEMSPDIRKRLDAICISLEQRGALTLKSWIAMLDTLETSGASDGFIDWMEVERIDGKAIDVGLYRHYIDPMKPFAASIRPHIHGMTVTSATLQDKTGNEAQDKQTAIQRTGAQYLCEQPEISTTSSPFNYADNTKVFIINDVNKNDLEQVAAAYRALFTASNGGALGLFTAVQRLRAVHKEIAPALEATGIPLYAQHVDDMDAGTLVDMFREDTNACLLGTDAMRDGVDVPGKSLRLLVFDRTPWPRPTILHKARRKAFGGRHYDEMITRLKLKQAFGRLIRRADDKGVFIMLDSALPSRLYGAFPEDVEIVKAGINEAISEIQQLQKRTSTPP